MVRQNEKQYNTPKVSVGTIRGVIYAPSSEDHRGDEVTEEFGSIDEFLRTLKALGGESGTPTSPTTKGRYSSQTSGGMVERLAVMSMA